MQARTFGWQLSDKQGVVFTAMTGAVFDEGHE